MEDILISPTQLAMWRTCPRSYKFKYIQHKVPIVIDEKLTFGRMWDEATRIWWEKGLDAVHTWLVENAGAMDELDAIRIAHLIKHYEPPPEFELVNSQIKVDVSIYHPETSEPIPRVKLRCKADSLMNHGGSVVVREAKITKQDITGYGPFWRALQVNSQVGFYWLAFRTDYMVYDVAHKPQIKPSNEDIANAAKFHIEGYDDMSKNAQAKARKEITSEQQIDAYSERMNDKILEDPDAFYQWRRINKTDSDVQKAQWDLWGMATMLLFAREHQIWPRYDHSCVSFYGNCSYLPVCSGQTTIDDDGLYTEPDWAVGKNELPF
jgi:hypothetical protein